MYCFIFGHADAYNISAVELESKILKIAQENTDIEFLVGNNGSFDKCTQSVLERLCQAGKVNYTIVLSRIDELPLNGCFIRGIFPDELATALPKYAISKRNDWIIKRSDLALCYVSQIASNSFKMLTKLQRKGVEIINLAD